MWESAKVGSAAHPRRSQAELAADRSSNPTPDKD
jgi:hypothetical protein